MENEILRASGMPWESFVLRDNEIWLSANKVKSLEKFEKELEKTGLVETAKSYPLSSITEVSFNEAKESVKLLYQNEKGKNKKVSVDFEESSDSIKFGNYLGEKLGLTRSQKEEKKWQPLLTNGFLLIVAIGGAISFATGDDLGEVSSSARGRRRTGGAIVRMIVDTIGTTGATILCVLMALYFAYKMYSRFKSPASEVVYVR